MDRDKIKWKKLGPHKWKSNRGHIIARYWTLTGLKTSFFLVYLDQDSYWIGSNVANLASLKEAKNFCESLENSC